MRRLFLYLFTVTLLLLTSGELAYSQTQGKTVVGDSRGKNFWLAFPKNALIEGNKLLTLKLFITSDKSTDGVVTIPGLGQRTPFHVNPSQVLEITLDSQAQILQSEMVQRLGVHVESDNDVAVFGLSHRPASTDTYLAYPVNVLGTTYRAVGYYPLPSAGQGFASEFAIVATEDHTLVNLSLTADTRGGRKAGDTFSIELQQGETYMVHGTSEDSKKSDLTGSLVTSNKPVGFFIGHSCAQVPQEVSYCDQLLEMEPPIPSWGRQFYVGKFSSKTQYAMRVIASEDSTQVFVDNKLVAKLKAGAFYEDNHMVDNSLITASAPVLVAEYAQSSEADSIRVGDPFMLLITPTEQFLNYYRFVTPVSGDWHHYINLVVPLDAEASLRVDGRSVPPRYFHGIGISKFGVAQYEIGFGSHAVSCDKPFGLYSYGFGVGSDNFDSYGNDGGQLVETVPITPDTARPIVELVSDDASRSLALIARDDRLFDAGLAKITVIDSDNFATPVEVPKFDKGAPEVPLLFRISNPNACGFMSIRLEDAAKNVSYWVICRTRSSENSAWFYSMKEGRENICPSCRSWTVQFITTPSFTESNVLFPRPDYLKGPDQFDQFSTRLSGGFQGDYVFPLDKGIQFAGGIGYSNFTGAAMGTHSTFVQDSILYGTGPDARLSKLIEQFTTEASLSYLTVNGGVYYYAIPEKLYLYAGLAAGFLISSNYIETSDIIFPSTLADSTGRSTSSRSLTLASGSLPHPTAFHIALELAPGMQFKLNQQFSLLAGLYMNFPFFNAVNDLNWHLTSFGARIGLQYRR